MEIERKFLIKKTSFPITWHNIPVMKLSRATSVLNRLYASADRTTNIILPINQRDSWPGKNTIFL